MFNRLKNLKVVRQLRENVSPKLRWLTFSNKNKLDARKPEEVFKFSKNINITDIKELKQHYDSEKLFLSDLISTLKKDIEKKNVLIVGVLLILVEMDVIVVNITKKTQNLNAYIVIDIIKFLSSIVSLFLVIYSLASNFFSKGVKVPESKYNLLPKDLTLISFSSHKTIIVIY